MAAPHTTNAGTATPQVHAGLPQMDVGTFPSQIFWLVVTFGLLFIVLSRMTLPRIASTIATRRNRIEGDLSTAERSRQEATETLNAYETALASARTRALALTEENHKSVATEIERLKNAADTSALEAVSQVEKRIAADREKLRAKITSSAAQAAAAIVERLSGARVAPEDAAGAVEAIQAKRT